MLTFRRPTWSASPRASGFTLPVSGIVLAVIAAALLRLAIIPITYGHDFVVWNDATKLLLRGVNPYTHWRAMPNAYPYLPVFLYILLPLQWLALHSGISFTILGKLPIALADLAVGVALYHCVRRSGRSTRAGVVAACLYLFNPLVLYNSDFLGRFDGVALAFLLPALLFDGVGFALLYGLAVATKTFPIFILPALLIGRYRRTPRELLGAAAVVVVVAIPFLLWDPVALLDNVTVRAFANPVPWPRGLSWQYVIGSVPFYVHLGAIFYVIFLAAILRWRNQPPLLLCALTFSAFLLVDHKIWEQYLTWPLPFLIALAVARRDRAAGLLAAGLTVAALFMNEQGNPVDHRFYMRLAPYPPITVNVLLALGIVLYIALTMWPPRLARTRRGAIMAVTTDADAGHSGATGALTWLRAYRYTALVLALGLLVRAVLLPLTSGGDFNMWNLTAAAALHGQDTYAHTPLPISKAGPYAYFPLYLYILLPLKWLSLHTGLPYIVLGKLPVVLGDVVTALALAAALRRRGLSERAGAAGAALFFLNPLVLYNGAFYGRFDSLCLATLLLAWRYLECPTGRGGWLALWFALGVTLKTFPIFLLPYVVLRTGLRRGLVVTLAAVALPLAVSLPYLLDNARRFVYIVFLYDSAKGPRQFTWQFVLLDLGLSARTVTIVSYGLLALFVLAVLAFMLPLAPADARGNEAKRGSREVVPLARPHEIPTSDGGVPLARHHQITTLLRSLWRGDWGERLTDPYTYAAVGYVLFLLLSKVVYEQYFLWPLPFLAMLVVRDHARMAGLLLVVLSITGLLANDWIHPFGYRPGPALWLNALIAVTAASFVLSRWRARAAQAQATVSTNA